MTIFGWDMSHFDAPSIGGALAESIEFVTHKAGGDATDTELPTWWAGVRGLDPGKVLLGAYWVLRPGNPVGRADAFIARLDAACPGWRDRPFILQLDCEKWNGDAGTVPSRTEIKAFCDHLVAKMPKLRPVVYAPKWVYGNGLAGLPYPLWASSYVTGSSGPFKTLYPGDSSSRWGAYSGQTPAILQYSSSAAIGGQTTCDANAFRGTKDQLEALVAPGWNTDMTTVDLTPAAVEDVWNADVVTNPHQRSNALTDPQQRAAFALGDAWQLLYDARAALADIKTQITVLGQQVGAAPTAADVAAGLLPQLTASILAALPEGALTVEQVTQAVVDGTKTALRDGVGS